MTRHGWWLAALAAATFIPAGLAAGESADTGPSSFAAPDLALAPAAPAAAADKPAAPADHPVSCPFCEAKAALTRAVPWLSVGGDIRLREQYAQDLTSLHDTQIWHFQRYRERVWWRIAPTNDLAFNFRLTYEPRWYQHPESRPDPEFPDAIFDEMNVEWKKFLGLPVTLKVGRQDIFLGDKWLVYDGTPLDGSRTAFFDAARATIAFAPETKTTLDVIYIDQRADSGDRIKPFNDQDLNLAEANSKGVILYGSNKSIKDTTIEPYFIYKHDEWVTKPLRADMYTFGLRGVRNFGEHWIASAELAKQFGHKFGRDLDSLGFTGRTTYKFNDPNDNQVYLGYEFDSGDTPGSHGRDEGFDRLWGRGVIWSEMFNAYIDTLEGPTAMSSNLHRISMGWQASFADPLKLVTGPMPYTLNVDYHLLFADEHFANIPGVSPAAATGSFGGGHFRGQLPRGILSYKFNEHVSGHLIGEFFWPGDYYSDARHDMAMFLRYQLVIAW